MSAVHPATTIADGPRLTDEQRRSLLRDGYVVVRNAVPAAEAMRMRELVIGAEFPAGVLKLMRSRQITDLYNKSMLRPLMEREMGPHSATHSAQIAMTPGRAVRTGVASADKEEGIATDLARTAHIDGGWGGSPPGVRPSEMTAEALHTWGSDADAVAPPKGGNHNPLWQDRERRLSLGSFTALVGVCLSDQTQINSGQLGVRRGAHEVAEAFFRMQRDAGGPVGGGGPLWPRLVGIAGDKAYAGFLPDAMVRDFPDVRQAWARFEHPDWAWPQLTPLLMAPGDAVVLLHSCPHSPTPNYSDDPRINVYYRLRRWRPDNPLESDDPRIASWHGTDHPDRARAYGPDGGFLDYSASPGYDPFATSIDRLCDHWADWGEDMQALAADRRRAREAVGTSRL